MTMEQQEAKYLPESKDVTYWYFYNPVCCLRSHCQLWQDSTRLNRFICTVHGVDHICGMMEEQWGPLPHQKYVGWRCPIYFCEETQTIRCYMTGHKLCSPGEFKDPRVFVESQDEYTKAQLSLSYEFSDQNISTMLRDYDIEGLCAATCSVTGDYLTEEEQSHFFHLLCHFNKTYCANHEKPIFNKTNDFKILGCIVSSMSQGQHQYGNQYRLYTSLRSEVDSILKVIKPQVYNKSAILRVKKPKCVNQPDGVKRRKTNPNPNPNQQPKSNTKPTKPNTQQCHDGTSKQTTQCD